MNRRIARVVHTLMSVLLLMAIVDSESKAQSFHESLTEGWNAWRVAAADDSVRCCYSWSIGRPKMKACDLDTNRSVSVIDDDRTFESTGEVQVYTLISNGHASRILALSPRCPVERAEQIRDLGVVNTADSIAWLGEYVLPDDELAEDAINAIAAHEGSIVALIAVVEDRRLALEIRENAVFRMAQSDSDAAFDYLAALIAGRR